MRPDAILPGATLGMLGAGQLGRMFALAARNLGYRVHTFAPETDSPAGQVADRHFTASYDDLDAIGRFAQGVSAVTFEFENVSAEALAALERRRPVRPGANVLHTTQHRLREKTFLTRHGFPTTQFAAVRSMEDVRTAVRDLGVPAVLKTAAFGYDGKGQSKVSTLAEAEAVVSDDPTVERIYEAFVDFEREVSVVAARGQDGSFSHWGVIENAHQNHILDVSVAPADVPPSVAAEAVKIAAGILEQLDVVGVLCVEFFLTRDHRLLVNELAPRPHNSGHLTIDATLTSQFEQQVRTVCGLPMGATWQLRPAAMANLLGDLWAMGEPDWRAALAIPGVKLHLYGKAEPRPGRKMGHLTALANSIAQARETVVEARRRLTMRGC